MPMPSQGKFRHTIEIFEFSDEPNLDVEAVRKHCKVHSCMGAFEPNKGQRYWGAVNGFQDDRTTSHTIYIRAPQVAIDATQRIIVDSARLCRIENVMDINERGRFLAIQVREERDVRTDLPRAPVPAHTHAGIAPERAPGPMPDAQPFKF